MRATASSSVDWTSAHVMIGTMTVEAAGRTFLEVEPTAAQVRGELFGLVAAVARRLEDVASERDRRDAGALDGDAVGGVGGQHRLGPQFPQLVEPQEPQHGGAGALPQQLQGNVHHPVGVVERGGIGELGERGQHDPRLGEPVEETQRDFGIADDGGLGDGRHAGLRSASAGSPPSP